MTTRRQRLGTALLLAWVVACATPAATSSQTKTKDRADAPWVGELIFTPAVIGDRVKVSFNYRNVKGGLANSQIQVDYRSSLEPKTRKRTTYGRTLKTLGTTHENGIGEAELQIKATDRPPFELTYFVVVTDQAGRRSNEARGTLKFKK